MHRARSKRKQIIRSTIVYTVMLMTIFGGLVAGVLYTLGYRIDTTDGSIAQGGLLQIGSIPSGSKATLDKRQLSGTTPIRVDASAGSHTVEITQEGYRPWHKKVSIDPGMIYWANYARLVPIKPVEEVQQQFESLHAVLPADKKDLILAQLTPTSNIFKLIDLGGGRANSTNIELPRQLISSPHHSDQEPTYKMMQWDESDRLVLIEYSYPDYRGWIVLDTGSPANSVNLSDLLDDSSSVKKIMFDQKNGRAMYLLANNVLRRLDVSGRSLSVPLARNVTDIWQSHDGVVTFATSQQEDGTRTVGYYTQGANKSRTLQKFQAQNEDPTALVIGEYLGRQYAAVLNGTKVRIYRLSLHSSDSSSKLELTQVGNVVAPETLSTLEFSPHDRFVYMQYGATYTVYDIELDKVSIATAQGDQPVSRTFGWLDKYHVWSDRGERLRWYEFDGENTQDITSVAVGFAPKLLKNNRHLYVIQSAEAEQNGFNLVRVQLRI